MEGRRQRIGGEEAEKWRGGGREVEGRRQRSGGEAAEKGRRPVTEADKWREGGGELGEGGVRSEGLRQTSTCNQTFLLAITCIQY